MEIVHCHNIDADSNVVHYEARIMKYLHNHIIVKYFILQILQKIGLMESLFSMMKHWMVNVLLPAHLKLVGKLETVEHAANEVLSNKKLVVQNDISQTRNLVLKIVEIAIANPKEVGFTH